VEARPFPLDIKGMNEAQYTANKSLFNLETLPPRMVILGSGFVALEMTYCFATFGSNVNSIYDSQNNCLTQRKQEEIDSKMQ
jgi:pyruvate/2-oxoglutarate dehydrogenase complex dihydrolipoamide dehydrogenase (E3) component